MAPGPHTPPNRIADGQHHCARRHEDTATLKMVAPLRDDFLGTYEVAALIS